MEFIASQEDLSFALQTVGKAVSTRTTLPILSGVLLAASDEGLTLVGNDLEIAISCRIPAKVSIAGRTVMTSSYLSEIIRRIPEGEIRFRLTGRGDSVQITWGKSEFSIHCSPAEQFPELPSVRAAEGLSMEQGSLRQVIRQSVFAVSRNDSMPTPLSGVNLEFGPQLITAVSTDGFRVACARLTCDGAPLTGVGLGDAIVPGRALTELARILVPQEDGMAFRQENQIFFDLGAVQFYSRLIEGEYPRVLQMIPQEYSTVVRMRTAEIHDACERVALVSEAKRQGQAVRLEIKPNTVVITSSSAEVGRAYEEVDAHVTGEGLDILFNARFLVEGLRQIDTEEVLFELINPESAGRLRPAEGDNFFYVVLPMRV